MMRLALIGAPASGKGTQAAKLTETYDIPHISTGDILRKEIANESEIGKQVKDILSSGKLVSDDLMIEIIKGRFKEADCVNGFILDGFPRTIVQAEKLEEMVHIDAAIYINTPDEIILARITARENCPDCGATYNKIFLPSEEAGVCDKCHGTLVQRKDDTREACVERLSTFHEQSAPLVEYYKGKGVLHEFYGDVDAEELATDIAKAVKK